MTQANAQAPDPIQAAIEAAQQSAGAAVTRNQSVATIENTPAPAPAVAVRSAMPTSLDDFDDGGLAVDAFIKVTPYGLLIPKSNDTPVPNATVRIDLSECVAHLAVKASRGKDTKYWKTYNGTSTPDGMPWEAAMAAANAMQPGQTPYKSVDIPMTLLEAVGAGKVGDILGYSLSTTNKKAFSLFLKAVDKAGLERTSAVVHVKLGHEVLKSDSYTWGVVTFDLLGSADQ
jgi:hypothetical protein